MTNYQYYGGAVKAHDAYKVDPDLYSVEFDWWLDQQHDVADPDPGASAPTTTPPPEKIIFPAPGFIEVHEYVRLFGAKSKTWKTAIRVDQIRWVSECENTSAITVLNRTDPIMCVNTYEQVMALIKAAI
jgi:hypothetical protein